MGNETKSKSVCGLEEEVIYRVCSGELDTIPLQDLQGLLMMPMKIQKEDGVVALGVFTDVGESGKRKRKEKKGNGGGNARWSPST